jgi:galactan 5-O-arabinofuranosyltransferase
MTHPHQPRTDGVEDTGTASIPAPTAVPAEHHEPPFTQVPLRRLSALGLLRSTSGRWGRRISEVAVAVGAALLFAWWSVSIGVDPLTRVGQVSGLAWLQFRLFVIAVPLLAVTALCAVRSPARWHAPSVRLACALVSGLATGFTAGGMVIALRGTPWPVQGQSGDDGRLESWADAILRTGHLPNIYPPGLPYAMAFLARYGGFSDPAFALKWLIIACIALTAPACYLSWRLLLRPLPALVVSLVSAIPVVLPYKPYSPLVLVVFVPLAAKLLQTIRRAPGIRPRRLLAIGVGLGVAHGLLVLLYSGWFVWSAPGLAVAFAVLLPWRSGRQGLSRVFVISAAAGGSFLAVAGPYLWTLLSAAGTAEDRWCSTMVLADPGYIAMLPNPYPWAGEPGMWPPPGEFGGVGLFTLVLLAGVGGAIALGLRRSSVAVTVACLASAWAMRFWIASRMEQTQAVQLYPRTFHQILYCCLVLVGLTSVLLFERVRSLVRRFERRPVGSPRYPFAATGLLAAAVLAAGMAGSATADPYLPVNPQHSWTGGLTWTAQSLRKPDGTCPRFAPGGRCAAPRKRPFTIPDATDPGRLVCEYRWRR